MNHIPDQDSFTPDPALPARRLAAGVPVIATPACGLDLRPGLTLIPPGNSAALIAALKGRGL